MAISLEGQTLGKYQVLEPLGSGGMARVYRGYHPQLNRYVAIKVLRSDLVEDEQFLQRFRREAQSVATLRHPNIIHVHDFDVQEDTYFMVMELLDGDTLHTRLNDYRIRNEQMPYGEMVRILLDVLDGLAFAHHEGMIHRDIKPANILLTKRGQAVVADFGIAQIVGGTQHTVSGALLGTLNYMAPEQGLKGTSDVRSDLYSLGVVMYEMLTRHPPYDADTPLAILMKHVNDPLPLPRTIDPLIPTSLEMVVLKAMAKSPDDRFQHASEMADALRQAAQDANLELPERISLPMSFTTEEDHSESVAVYSGTERGKLADQQFAADDTMATMAESWTAHLDSLKVEQTDVVKSDISVTVDVATNEESSTLPQKGNAGTAVINALGFVIVSNLLMIMIGGMNGANVYERAWPLIFFFLGIGGFMVMRATHYIWWLIPSGIVLGNGFLFFYYTTTENWEQWAFLWPLEVFIVFGFIWRTIHLAQRPDHEKIAYRLARRWIIGSSIVMGFFTFIALVG